MDSDIKGILCTLLIIVTGVLGIVVACSVVSIHETTTIARMSAAGVDPIVAQCAVSRAPVVCAAAANQAVR